LLRRQGTRQTWTAGRQHRWQLHRWRVYRRTVRPWAGYFLAQLRSTVDVVGVMRRVGLYLIAVLLLLLAAVSVSDATRGRHFRCGIRHARVIAETREAAVVVGEHGEVSGYAFGCANGHRTYSIGLPESCGKEGCLGVSSEVLNGWTVAYQWVSNSNGVSGGIPSYSWFVVVRDLRTDRVLRKVPTGTPLRAEQGEVGVGRVQSMVVKRDGVVAWIAADNQRSPGERLVTPPCELLPTGASICPGPRAKPPFISSYDVYASGRRGTRLLASGTDVAPHSLKLAASTLYWTQGGTPMSAPLD